ncbi:hypothetical protein [Nitratireductor luteus]|uniref:hypothetical protein n=1 Tax=Nitratireductor luteus TaxID=2976980 RepID=UPI00223F52F6|nr:hypothetical protein [Nitratireductor luteus]
MAFLQDQDYADLVEKIAARCNQKVTFKMLTGETLELKLPDVDLDAIKLALGEQLDIWRASIREG